MKIKQKILNSAFSNLSVFDFAIIVNFCLHLFVSRNRELENKQIIKNY